MIDSVIRFRLYVAGTLPNSERAMGNLTRFCQRHLPERHRIEIVDVLESPHRALEDRVLLTPTLLILTSTARTIVGDLSNTAVLHQALAAELDRDDAPGTGGSPK